MGGDYRPFIDDFSEKNLGYPVTSRSSPSSMRAIIQQEPDIWPAELLAAIETRRLSLGLELDL